MTTDTNNKPSFLARLGRFLLRLFFVFVIGIALGVGIYFGGLLLYRVYVRPVQSYAARLDALETGQQQIEQQATSRLETLTERVEALEVQSDTTKESLAALDGRLSAVESAQEKQAAEISTLSGEVETLQTTAGDLQTSQEELQAELADAQQAVEDLGGLQADVEQALQGMEENTQSLEALSEELQSFSGMRQALQVDTQLLKAMELLTRSRIFLIQGNTSLAQAEIQSAAELLTGMQEQVADGQAGYLGEVVTVLDESLTFLPRSPLLAADRVEGAWQMLFAGLPEPVEEATAEPTAESTATPTPTPTP